MDKYDTCKYAPGMVYELQKQPNENQMYTNTYNGEAYIILSSVRTNSRLDTVIVAPVIEGDDKSPFGIQFMIRRGGCTIVQTVCLDRMFKALKKRLVRFRYSVDRVIVDEINAGIQQLFFGERLYTKDQALAVAYREEMCMRNMHQQNSEIHTIPIDNATSGSADFYEPEYFKPRSLAEEEEYFAMQMMKNPALHQPEHYHDIENDIECDIEEIPVNEDNNIDLGETKEEIKNPLINKSNVIIVKGGTCKEKPKAKPAVNKKNSVYEKFSKYKYSEIYEKWEDFLTDYATLQNDQLLIKYNLPDITTLYMVGKNCKSIAAENGIDTKIFNRRRGGRR